MSVHALLSESEKGTYFGLSPWRELALLMLVGMEISWVTPWFRSLTPATYAVSPVRGALILAGIMLVSLWAVRLMDAVRLRMRIRQGITLGLLLVGVLIGLKTLLYAHESVGLVELLNRPLRSFTDWRTIIPDEFVIILTVLVGWWRGISLAQERIGPMVVRDHFVIGIIMYIVFAIINTLLTGETPGGFIFIFIFCALLAMASARISVLSTLRGGSLNVFDRRWFLGVLFASAITVGLALFFGDFFSNYLLWIASIFIGIVGLLAILLWGIISPILALVIRLMNSSAGTPILLQELTDQLEQLLEMMETFSQRMADVIGATQAMETLARWAPSIKGILLGVVIILVVGGILYWLAFQIWKEHKRRLFREDQQSLLVSGAFWDLLRAALRRQWEELVNNLGNAVDFRRQARLRAAARVRQVYTDLMDLCDDLGHPRPDAQTPLEFMPDLEALFPEQNQAVKEITQAYLKVRYGELPETRAEVDEVESAWNLVDIIGKEKKAVMKQQKNKPRLSNIKDVQKPRSKL